MRSSDQCQTLLISRPGVQTSKGLGSYPRVVFGSFAAGAEASRVPEDAGWVEGCRKVWRERPRGWGVVERRWREFNSALKRS